MAKSEKTLRAVGDDERHLEPPTLAEAVESGDVLNMLKAQRRLIAESLLTAAENTRPQLNNELNKLHTLIAAEEDRRNLANPERVSAATAKATRSGWDSSAI